ncbi:transporter substrate-binding domain-containing protein [Aquibaculum sediminis]|uniref:transporter substrate-binding domain-containing protein n=1 Tax=Aquibaculum sediminis TaxID=3231907 RepID=UPI0034548567
MPCIFLQRSCRALAATSLLFPLFTYGAAASANDDVVQDLAVMVPDEYKDGLVSVYDPQYPPSYFIDEDGKMVGYVLDFQEQMAAKLGVESRAEQAKFAGIIPGILGGRYHTSYFHDTPERRERMDFVDVHQTGTVVMVQAGNPDDIDLHELCGHVVGVTAGAHQQLELMPMLQEECAEQDQPPIEELAFSGLNEGSLAVRTGRAQAWLGDAPSVGYIIKQTDGVFATTPTPYLTGYSGFAFKKGDPMALAFKEALGALMEDGSYMQILEDWNMAETALDAPLLNGEP